MRVSNRRAVCCSRFSSDWKASLKPRPGREGMMRWKGWVVGRVGVVRGVKRGARRGERFGVGKEGSRRSGIACGCGERM